MSKYKRLQEIKFLGFRKGLLSSSEPNAGVEGLIRSVNLLNFTRPEKLQSRPSYRLKYTSPIGTQNNLINEEFISFDNYFDRKTEGAEITLYLTKATTTSPYTNFNLTTLQVYARPFYNGNEWVDNWENLTKIYITTIKSFENINFLDYIRVNGNFGNLSQWRMIDYTVNKEFPYTIIKSHNHYNDTRLLINNREAIISLNVGDVVVLMRDYIPISTLQANAEVSTQDVEFIRGTNKAIIGFGGHKDTRALVIEHVNSWLYMNTAPYDLSETEDENFRHTNRLVIDQIVQENKIINANTQTYTGNLPAGDYSGKFVLNFMGTELQEDNEVKVSIENNKSIIFQPNIHLGLLSRRLKSVELFFNHDLLNHYKIKTYDVSGNDNTNKIWKSNRLNHIYIDYEIAPDSLTIHNENCATSPSNSNSAGSWLQLDTVNYDGTKKIPAGVGVDNGDYYVDALCQQVEETDPNTGYGINEGALYYPLSSLDNIPNGKYVIKIKFMISYIQLGNYNGLYLELVNNVNGSATIKQLSLYNNIWQTETINVNFDEYSNLKYLKLYFWSSDAPPTYSHIRIADLKIIPQQNVKIDADSTYGEELYTRLGYIGDLVKDFKVSHIRHQDVFVTQAYINEKYRTTIFKNAINSDGSNMQTIIPAENAYEIESSFGQNIVGISSVPNSNLIVFTESTISILDIDRGVSVERIIGSGLKSRFSLVTIKGNVYYASDNDLMKISPSTGYIPMPLTAFTIRKDYNNILRKDLITACFDRFNAYRLALDIEETIDYKELIFVDEFGFSELSREHHPILLKNGRFGFVWFVANDFNVYVEPYNLEEVAGISIQNGDYSGVW